MTKTFCDKCKTECKDAMLFPAKVKIEIPFLFASGQTEFDICQDCVKLVREFLGAPALVGSFGLALQTEC